MYQYAFEKLDVWHLSRQFAVAIYRLTKEFPDEEKFGMVNQMRRSARSVAANIAEGSTRFSNKEQSHFYSIAFGSAIEILNDLVLANDLGFIKEEHLFSYRTQLEVITHKLNGLQKATRTTNNNP